MKRIALFISSLQKGGSERVMANLAEYLHGRNYEVVLVTQYKKENEYRLSPAIRRVYSEPDELQLQGGRAHNFFARYCALRKIWKIYKPDIILSFLGKNNLMAVVTAAFLPVKVAVSVRGEPTMEYGGKLMRFLAKLVFGFADAVVLQTKRAQEFFPKAVQKKSVILPNPLAPEFIGTGQEIGDDGKRDDVIVAAGRLDENKNHAMLIHAFARIADEYPSMELAVYGEGELLQKLEDLVREKGLAERISLPGSVENVAEKVRRARIFALTSNTEGMPNSVMEAMALGTPVVSTDCPCGGPAELIEDGVNGLLVPVGDAYALADAFRRILEDSAFEKKLGGNARDIVRKLNPEKVCKEWEEFLLRVAGEK